MRNGITAGGNWIIDLIKFVDSYPEEGNLANILKTEQPTNGGCPYSVLLDLAKLGTEIPLQAVGAIGVDEHGDFILNDCKKNNICSSLLKKKAGQTTSYTDVITVQSNGHRTFFHARGANATLDIGDFEIDKIKGRICLVGYLLLLDKLDEPDKEFGTRAAKLLSMLREAGIETAIDVVSENSDRFNRIVTPSLKFTDYLIFNEIEAGKVLEKRIRSKEGGIDFKDASEAADALLKMGVGKMVVIHFPEGAVASVKENGKIVRESVKSLKLPAGFIKGTVGAGDAFCAGCLSQIYRGESISNILKFGNGVAAASLSHPTASQGIKSVEQVKELIEQFS
ncbi:MAG: carbohydrate kinase family protein [Victivallales bacterium]|jgi:sugar/nucleoside kinase (ribokinase family)